MITSLPLDLDTIINKNTSFDLIKHDTATTVGILKGNEFGLPHNLLVKRFNNRGFLDFIIRKIFGSRARRLWHINLKFYNQGLPVPKPVTFIEPSFRQKNSFYLSLAIDNAENLANIYKKGAFHKPEEIARQLAQTIAQWHLAGGGHGDLKWSNILFQRSDKGYKFFLIDLDQSQLNAKSSVRVIKKDLTRFYRYGLELAAEEWVYSAFFPQYLTMIPDSMKSEIEVDDIKRRAYKDWLRKGQKRI
jgi:tRNA A-37 threonylcarbamoyl transferase component Bud32